MQTRSQAVIANRHPDTFQNFRVGVQSIFRQWTALELAVHHGWGGQNGVQKVEDLLNLVIESFNSSERVYKDDISLLLDDVLEVNFNVICEDESTDELGNVALNYGLNSLLICCIGDMIVQLFNQCSKGETALLQHILTKEKGRINVLATSQGNI